MNLLVFTKRVPATQEEELRIIDDGKAVDLSKVPFKVNDWDNYAVEEAVRIVEKTGGAATAISIGDAESDEVLRRAIAMGAKDGFLIESETVLHDPNARATLICNFLKKEGTPFDAIFTGVQSEDDQFAAVGGILAAKLGLPYASMIIGIDAFEKDHVIARRELEGGLQERVKVMLPCVLSIQSGINEPRYVSIMGIRKASKVERKLFKAKEYEENVNSMIEMVKWTYPPKKGGATMLSGEMDGVCKELLGILKGKGGIPMSYALVVAEVRRGIFEERNLDAIGICALLDKDVVLLIPDGAYSMSEKLANSIVRAEVEETIFLNPLNMVTILEKVFDSRGKPDVVVFTHSSSGTDLASYAAGRFNLPLITDVSGFDKEKSAFYKSYYSDKIFGEFRTVGEGPYVITVRSGSFKEFAVEKASLPAVETVTAISVNDGRSFVEYVEEEKTEIDITKADFLLSVGRGIGNKDEIPDYEELAGLLRAVLSGSRPVIDKQWLPKPRQVGTSGKTVKPKVYLAMGISGAFQHIAGMKDSDCIIAVNKDPEAPIFQYAHFGIIADANKLRDKLKEAAKG